MSLLNLRKKKTEEPNPVKKLVPVDVTKSAVTLKRTAPSGGDFSVIMRPHISERASDEAAKGVYVFRVTKTATKPKIRAAIAALYKVTVEQVRIVNVHPKRITVKGKPGVRSGWKKAYVYLKAGQKIDNL